MKNQEMAQIINYELTNNPLFEGKEILLYVMDLGVTIDACETSAIHRDFKEAIFEHLDDTLTYRTHLGITSSFTANQLFSLNGSVEAPWSDLDEAFAKQTKHTGIRLLTVNTVIENAVRYIDVEAPYSDLYVGVLSWKADNISLCSTHVDRLDALARNALNGNHTLLA